MKRRWMLVIMLAGASVAVTQGCGRGDDDDNPPTEETVTPPDNTPRDIPVQSGGLDYGEPDFEPAPFVPDMGEGPDMEPPPGDEVEGCCEVRFAIADPDGEENEDGVYLVGDAYPLDDPEGYALSYSDGVWSVDMCIPASYSGSYAYEFVTTVTSPDGEMSEFRERRINPEAPNEESLGTASNTWTFAETCDDARVDQHARTSL